MEGCTFKFSDSNSDVSNWDAYVGVHLFRLEDQKKDLIELQRAGKLRGVRIDINSENNMAAHYFLDWAATRGIEVLGIFSNKELNKWKQGVFSDNVLVKKFRNYVRNFPNIKYWEVGNEPKGWIYMSAKEYIRAFKLIVKNHPPGIKLLNAASAGTETATRYLQALLDNGLIDIAKTHTEFILSVHYYSWRSIALQEFEEQIDRLPTHTKVWVTETGVGNWAQHLSWVREVYPKLRYTLRAQRIYWYDFGNTYREHCLVYYTRHVEYSPLYKALVGLENPASSGLKEFFPKIPKIGNIAGEKDINRNRGMGIRR